MNASAEERRKLTFRAVQLQSISAWWAMDATSAMNLGRLEEARIWQREAAESAAFGRDALFALVASPSTDGENK